jgi:hypothetical protein
LDDLSIGKSGVLKLISVIVFVTAFMFSGVFDMKLGVLTFDVSICLKSALTEMSISYSCLLLDSISWEYLFLSF